MLYTTITDRIDTIELTSRLLDQELHNAARTGYRLADFTHLGIARRRAQQLLDQPTPATQITMTGNTAADPTQPQIDDVITLLAADRNNGARELLYDQRAYFRLESLDLPVPMAASWLSVTTGKQLRTIFPIRCRAYVPSATAGFDPDFKDSPDRHRLAQLIATTDYQEIWGEGPTAAFLVGDPVDLERPIELGYAGGGVAGTRSYFFHDLEATDKLIGTPTITGKSRLSLTGVQDVLNVLAPDEVTSYGEIGQVLGHQNAGQAIAGIIGRKEIPLLDAARVIPNQRDGEHFRFPNQPLDSHHTPNPLRFDALRETPVPCELVDNDILIPARQWVSADELNRRL